MLQTSAPGNRNGDELRQEDAAEEDAAVELDAMLQGDAQRRAQHVKESDVDDDDKDDEDDEDDADEHAPLRFGGSHQPPEEDDDSSPKTLMGELRLFGHVAGPTVLIQLLYMLQFTYTTHYAGLKFGATGLSGFSLANLSGNLTGWSIIIGFLSASETLCPQAFSLKQYAEVGQITIRSYLLCLLLLLPLVPVWQNMDVLLVMVNQPEESAALAKRFLSRYLFAFPANLFFECAVRFYRAQNVVTPFIAINVLVLVLHPAWMHLFSQVLELGFDGLPLAHVASAWTGAVCCLLMLQLSSLHHPETWPKTVSISYVRDTVLNRPAMTMLLRLGLPGIFSMSEWWFWEVICFFCGTFGEQSLAAHTVAYALIPLSFMIPLGFSVGATTRVGALLAQQDVAMARRLAVYMQAACAAAVVTNATCVFLARDMIISAFTADEEVAAMCRQIWPWVSVFLMFDATMGFQSGLIRALALQSTMSWAVLCTLWLFGIPFIYFLSVVKEHHLLGVWQAMPLTYLLLDVLLVLAVVTKDWAAYAGSIEQQFEMVATNPSAKVQEDPEAVAAAETDMTPQERERQRQRRLKLKRSDP